MQDIQSQLQSQFKKQEEMDLIQKMVQTNQRQNDATIYKNQRARPSNH